MIMKEFENKLYKEGIDLIAGIDEVGRGPLVGSVVACAVILPKDFYDERIKDSKKISEKKRNELYELIKEKAISIGIGMCDNKEIDKINILEASKKAMLKAINNLDVKPKHLLIDALTLDTNINQTSIIKGDQKSISIASASIVAKVIRDEMMYKLDEKYPMYGFATNKGYPTKKHIEAINKYGIITEHRKTFKPICFYKEKLDKNKIGV